MSGSCLKLSEVVWESCKRTACVWELSGSCLGALRGHSEGSQSAIGRLFRQEAENVDTVYMAVGSVSRLGAVWELPRGGRVEGLSGSCRRAALEWSGSSRRLSEGSSGAV